MITTGHGLVPVGCDLLAAVGAQQRLSCHPSSPRRVHITRPCLQDTAAIKLTLLCFIDSNLLVGDQHLHRLPRLTARLRLESFFPVCTSF